MKNIIDYEVEGCWTSLKSKNKCRLCGTELQSVPKTNHFNSQYWELASDDGLILKCCPKGCNVKTAKSTMKEFLKIRKYCTNNSKSWDYKLKYNKIKDAWINRRGKVYPLESMGHIAFANEYNTNERSLEIRGWLKLTSMEFFWEKKLSKRQIDMIFDYIMVIGTKKNINNFQKYIDREIGIFKLEIK